MSTSESVPTMPKSSATYLPWFAGSIATKMLPGCMSAWKKPSRNTCVKKISTPARASRGRSTFAARSSSMRPIGMPGHALHHQHLALGVVPPDLGDQQERRVAEVAAQLRAVRGLAREVELVADRLLELGHDRARLQALAVRPQPLDQHRGVVHQREVVLDHAGDVRPQHLDRHRRRRGAVLGGQLREMHLRDRRARDRLAVEAREHFADRAPVDALERRDHLLAGKRRHAVLQLRELVGDVRRQEVAARRQHLAELHEDRTEVGEREPQPHRARARQVAPEQHAVDERLQAAHALVAEQEFVEPVLEGDVEDAKEAQDAHPSILRGQTLLRHSSRV